MRKITKLFNTRASSIDENSRSVTFKISDNQPDRMGEIVDQKSWKFESYMKNPVVLWGHNPEEPENVLGTAESLDISADGSETTAKLSFDSEINPKAALVFEQIKKGTLRTVSVGFINHSEEMQDDTPVLKDNELLEISVVPIPANPRAIALSLKSGEINRKDARWLMEGMRQEAALLENQLKEDEHTNERKKTMTDEQAQGLLDGFAKLTEKLEAQDATIAALSERLPEPAADETDEEKQAREIQEAADQAAAEAAANTDDPAKSGDDDQDGAGEDEFDEDAELTPEQETELEAAFAELAN